MPDIQFFDAAAFFTHKIAEVEQTLIIKKAEFEILQANRRSLSSAIASLAALSSAEQQSIASELASLREVLQSTDRNITALDAETLLLANKLSALRSASHLVELKESQ